MSLNLKINFPSIYRRISYNLQKNFTQFFRKFDVSFKKISSVRISNTAFGCRWRSWVQLLTSAVASARTSVPFRSPSRSEQIRPFTVASIICAVCGHSKGPNLASSDHCPISVLRIPSSHALACVP